jgi:hypothetical protein
MVQAEPTEEAAAEPWCERVPRTEKMRDTDRKPVLARAIGDALDTCDGSSNPSSLNALLTASTSSPTTSELHPWDTAPHTALQPLSWLTLQSRVEESVGPQADALYACNSR